MLNNYKQTITNFFNRRTSYDYEGKGHPENAKRFLDFVTVKPGQIILDLCTGTGLVAITVAKTVGQQGSVIGVDMSPGMLTQAKTKIEAEGIKNLELIEADVESVDFNNEQFDRIFCCSALVYVSDIPTLLNKCYRWLKPGGYLAFTSSNKGSHLSEVRVRVCKDLFDIDLPHIIRPLWTAEKCTKLLQDSGFQNTKIEKHLFRREKINDNYRSTQIENEFYPRGNPLSNLSPVQKQLLQVEYIKAVDHLIAETGVWQEANNLYVKAWKSA
ncbi:class I SAM-dependent methyltransferase [Pleurocapsa sp. PCC 7319]|uniref:class I SAM-dependent methyltransferase n=1 Tax=Pleurocapsa sp. PCC 7319 TaxID=118161 RepID=UPI00034D3BB0|nr:methyltransferase domain-containing protein [Pleurocapsa sp. PCC 7319]